jgi:hypothetical protein
MYSLEGGSNRGMEHQGGHVARVGKTTNVYNILVANPEGKLQVGGPERKWEDNIKNGS